MKDRERTIQFEMNYCQHYDPQPHGKGCKAGMDLKTVQVVPTGEKGYKWGPCIAGHTLKNPLEHCPKWIRRTREMGEKRADSVERSMNILTKVMPRISEWRKEAPQGKSEVIECPACNGKLHLSQSSYNGHVRARCETENCVNFIE